jgi:hypothetical protein
MNEQRDLVTDLLVLLVIGYFIGIDDRTSEICGLMPSPSTAFPFRIFCKNSLDAVARLGNGRARGTGRRLAA